MYRGIAGTTAAPVNRSVWGVQCETGPKDDKRNDNRWRRGRRRTRRRQDRKRSRSSSRGEMNGNLLAGCSAALLFHHHHNNNIVAALKFVTPVKDGDTRRILLTGKDTRHRFSDRCKS